MSFFLVIADFMEIDDLIFYAIISNNTTPTSAEKLENSLCNFLLILCERGMFFVKCCNGIKKDELSLCKDFFKLEVFGMKVSDVTVGDEKG